MISKDLFVFSLYFLQTRILFADLSWNNCDGQIHGIELLNVTVKPYPILAPGSVSIEIGIRTLLDIEAPVKVDLDLKKKVLFGGMPVPCAMGIGSCTYDDLCTLCPECSCPLQSGDHILKHTIQIDTSAWVILGNYQARVQIDAHGGMKGCAEIRNIHIMSA